MYRWIVLSFIVLNASMFEASKVSENVLKDNKGGDYDVIDVEIGNTDIAIIKKDGVILADEITNKDKEYSIIKYNRTCNVQFYEDPSDLKTCYEAFEDNESIPNDTKTEIKEECGDLDIAYVKAIHCNTEHGIQKEHVIIITTLVDVAEGDGGDTHVTSVGTESLDAIDLENMSASSYI